MHPLVDVVTNVIGSLANWNRTGVRSAVDQNQTPAMRLTDPPAPV